MKLYYAHCIAIYDTPQEARDLASLEDLGFEVVNPNAPGINEQCEQIRKDFHLVLTRPKKYASYNDAGAAIMGLIFKPMVTACDALAFRALPDGRVPAGVMKEIEWAREAGVRVLELPSNLSGRAMSVEQTREYLHEIGQR